MFQFVFFKEFLRMSFYGTNAALIFHCVGKDDVGKAFSVFAMGEALLPFISNPAYR